MEYVVIIPALVITIQKTMIALVKDNPAEVVTMINVIVEEKIAEMMIMMDVPDVNRISVVTIRKKQHHGRSIPITAAMTRAAIMMAVLVMNMSAMIPSAVMKVVAATVNKNGNNGILQSERSFRCPIA